MSDYDRSVTRDHTVKREFTEKFRGVLPACIYCDRPAAYVDVNGNPAHSVCADESSDTRLRPKIEARGGKIAANAGHRDLSELLVVVERQSAGPRAEIQAAPSREVRDHARIAHTVTRIDRTSPEFIARMSERDVYDLNRIQVDPFDQKGTQQIVDRARRAVDLAYFPAARDQAEVKDHIDKLLRRKAHHNWRSSALAERILATGGPEYHEVLNKIFHEGGSPWPCRRFSTFHLTSRVRPGQPRLRSCLSAPNRDPHHPPWMSTTHDLARVVA
jgi:hypothetical protein